MDTVDNQQLLTDLHTHILPGMDDGAGTLGQAVALLRAEEADGVGAVALTPHFHPRMGLETFLGQRAKAEAQLADALTGQNISIDLRLGAEVRMDAALLDMDMARLCLGGTRLILLELPIAHFPDWARQVLRRALEMDLVPLLAHVDRYHYLLQRPNTLVPLIEAGVFTHINASSLLAPGDNQNRLLGLIRHHLIHAVASDTHSLDRRPPLLGAAMTLIEEQLGADAAQRLNRQATALFHAEKFEREKPRPFRWTFHFGKQGGAS